MKKILAFTLTLLMVLSLCACGGSSNATKEDLMNSAESVSIDTIDNDTVSNIAKAKSLYCGKDLLIEGFIFEITEKYVSLSGGGNNVFIDAYLSADELAQVDTNQKIAIVGHTEEGIVKRPFSASGLSFDIQHYTMKTAYLVDDKFEIVGVLRGKNDSFENAYNIKIGNKDKLDLIYFSDEVDLSNLPFDKETTFVAKVVRSYPLVKYMDAIIK